MCRSAHVRLTESEQRDVSRLWGVMVPVYASIGLFLLASLVLNTGPRDGKMVTAAGDVAASASVAQR